MSVVINIKSLVGTLVVIGDDTKEMSKKVSEALLQVITLAQESQELEPDKSLKKSEAPPSTTEDSQ